MKQERSEAGLIQSDPTSAAAKFVWRPPLQAALAAHSLLPTPVSLWWQLWTGNVPQEQQQEREDYIYVSIFI